MTTLTTLSLAALLNCALLASAGLGHAQDTGAMTDHSQLQQGDMDMGGMDMGAMKPAAAKGPGADAPSSKAFAAANAEMHGKMAMEMTGNPDVDFLRGMIPHHEGAIAMAKVELQYGKDPKAKALAKAIIKAQEAEIAEMKTWLAKMGN